MEHPTLEPATAESGSSSLPTPTVSEAERQHGYQKRGSRIYPTLTGAMGAAYLPTPRANKIGGKSSEGFSPTLEQEMLPTPQAFDAKGFQKADLTDKTTKNGKAGGRANLREVNFLPTPRTCSAMAATLNPNPNHFPNLETVIALKMLATPAAADCHGSHGGGQGRSLRTDTANYRAETGERGQLNPCFVAEMMGFPITWFDIE